MTSIGEPQEETFITLADITAICRRGKKVIITTIAAFAVLGAVYPMLRPIGYSAEASFLDKGVGSMPAASGMMALMGGGSRGKSQTRSLLKSRKLMVDVVEELGMQASISKKGSAGGAIRRVLDNIKVVRAYKTKRQKPLFPDPDPDLLATNVSYQREYSSGLALEFTSSTTYKAFDNKKKVVGEGALGQPFVWKGGTFTLHQGPGDSPKANDIYGIGFTTIATVAEGLAKSLSTEPDEDDSNILRLKYSNGNRQMSAQFLNTTMEVLQHHLQIESERTNKAQLAYLNERHTESLSELETIMNSHAQLASNDITTTGFIDSEKQMAFLSQNQQKGRERLMQLSFELKRLQQLRDTDSFVLYDRYAPTADSEIINNNLMKIRVLFQKRDTLELALRKNSRRNVTMTEELFQQQVRDLDIIRNQRKDAEATLDFLKENKGVPPKNSLIDTNTTMTGLWYQRLQQAYKASDMATPEGQQQWCDHCDDFSSYLRNIARVLEVHETIMQERLIHQQNPQGPFQGIDLNTADTLYLAYNRELDNTEIQLQQNTLIITQASDPEFDLSALSTVVKDPVGQSIINKSSQLLLLLRDDSNRSTKELERINSELDRQRKFLTDHLQQTTQLISVRKDLVEDKIQALQNTTLDLLHQQISLEEKSLSDYLETRIENLEQEQLVLTTHLDDLEKQMAQLPKKWVSERLLKENINGHQRRFQEITQLVESKNLQQNLELIQAIPLDNAIPPVLPIKPRFFLYVILGVFAGGFFSVGGLLVRALIKGIPASEENLRYIGCHTSGSLSNATSDPTAILSDRDLATLRRVSSHCCQEAKIDSTTGRLLLLIEGPGPNYGKTLAHLLGTKGLRTLVVPFSFEENEGRTSGALQVATGKAKKPNIHEGQGYDWIEAGGASRHAEELVNTPPFQKMLFSLKKEYDWIIATSKASAGDAEAESLLCHADAIAVTIAEETQEKLTLYRKRKVPLTFILNEA